MSRNSDADRDDGSRVVRRRAAEQMEQSTVNTLYVLRECGQSGNQLWTIQHCALKKIVDFRSTISAIGTYIQHCVMHVVARYNSNEIFKQLFSKIS